MGWMVLGVIGLGVVGFGLYGVGIYNGLIALKHAVDRAWANIDVLLKQRHDELPKLVEPVKGYMAHERETLEAVIARMRTISQAEHVQHMPISRLRVFAASATVSNVGDIAAWLGPSTVVKQVRASTRRSPRPARAL